jgi:hypothetical protein
MIPKFRDFELKMRNFRSLIMVRLLLANIKYLTEFLSFNVFIQNYSL